MPITPTQKISTPPINQTESMTEIQPLSWTKPRKWMISSQIAVRLPAAEISMPR